MEEILMSDVFEGRILMLDVFDVRGKKEDVRHFSIPSILFYALLFLFQLLINLLASCDKDFN